MNTLLDMQLITNIMSIKNNQLPNGEFAVNPRFTRNIITIDQSHAATELRVDIANSEENPFPVDIVVSITAVFDISKLPESEVSQFLELQAVQILFPYVRNAVSTLTTTAMMAPIILPVIDVKQLFQNQP